MTLRIRSFFFGLSLPLRAIVLLFDHPSLVLWAALPFLITVLLFLKSIQLAMDFAELKTDWLLSSWNMISMSSWILPMVTGLMGGILLIIGGLCFSFFMNFFALPFHDLLAERTERLTTLPQTELDPSVEKKKKRKWISLLLMDGMKSFFAVFLTIFLLLLSSIPILNLFSFVGISLILSFQYLAYPKTRRGHSIRQDLGFLGDYFYSCFGFGLCVSTLISIPFVSCFFIPLAVIGGTLLFAASQNREKYPWLC